MSTIGQPLADAGRLARVVRSPVFRQGLLTILFLSFFAWYLYPLAVIDYFLIATDGFDEVPKNIEVFARSVSQDHLGLDEIPKLLMGLVGAGGLSLMLFEREETPVSSAVFGLLIALVTLLAAFAAVATYHLLVMYGDRLDDVVKESSKVQETLNSIAVSRFRELWVLIAALAGTALATERSRP